MAERMLGIETEYAFAAFGHRGNGPDKEEAVPLLMELARSKLPHLRGVHSRGIVLTNSSCMYVDTGTHVELATPECLNPWDVVRYRLAGERILADLGRDLAAADRRISEAAFFRCNVDYDYGSHSTWGCHESYLHRANTAVLPGQIIPHLVSRIVYAGAGGWNPRTPGLEFVLSPRVLHLEKAVSSESTHSRGIFHTKDEPLCGKGYHRLHLLCGESLCSETASWLKVGTTALVVAMVEAGLRPGDAVRLRYALQAMDIFARDTDCKAVVQSTAGKPLTAISVQRHYLEQAEAHVSDAFMPPWAGDVCRRWRAVLGQVERGAPESVATALDWPMKLALYKNRVRSRGFSWNEFPHWNDMLEKLRDALRHTECRDKTVKVDFILGKDSPIAATVEHLTPLVKQKGLTWDRLKPFLTLREELFETDWRFGQLGEKGVFAALDRTAGVLDHHVPGVDNIEGALTDPPAAGRAHIRGQFVKRFAGNNSRYMCHWDGVSDLVSRRVLDLSDPFETEERWREFSKREEKGRSSATRLRGILGALRSVSRDPVP